MRPFIAAIFLAAAFVTQAQTRQERIHTIALTGDIMMGTLYPTPQLPPDNGRHLFYDVAPVLRRADVAAGNLECVLADSGTTAKKVERQHNYAFLTPTAYVQHLVDAGYDFLSLANNHAYDFGPSGAASTQRTLQAAGLAYAGLRSHHNGVVIERGGVRYGFCAFGHNAYTHRHSDLRAVRTTLTALVARCDVLIVSFHGGAEGVKYCHLPYGEETYLDEPRGDLRAFAHFCIDAGADVVFGHGPHVTRALEVYKHHLIAYSLGNFCTPYGINLVGLSGHAPVLEVQVDGAGRFCGGRIHSYLQQRGLGPRTDPHHRVAQHMRSLTLSDVPHTPLRIHPDGRLEALPH